MKLYYYEYESCVFRPIFKTNGYLELEYDLYQGFLIDTPLGVLNMFSEKDEILEFDSLEAFNEHLSTRFPINFNMVELK